MANEDLEVIIGANIDNLIRELNKAKKGLSGFENRMSQFSNNLKKTGAQMRSVGATMSKFVTLPILAAGGASIKMASDFEESLNKVDVAFKSSSHEVREFGKTTLKTFGIAEGTALDMAALFGDMATSMGVATDDAADLSTELVGLAGDLSSFKNINIKEVTTALNGVFTGETESLKRLGIVMTETNLKQFALSKGMSDNLKVMSQAEKVQLRYAFILEKTKNAQGDFARTSGGSANQMRIFQESVKELSVSFGQLLLPIFTKTITKLNEIVLAFRNLSPKTKALTIAILGLTAAMPILISLTGTLLTVLGALISPIGLIAAGVAAVAFIIQKNWGEILPVITGIYNQFVDLYNSSETLRLSIAGLGATLKTAFIVAIAPIKLFINSFKTLWKLIKEFSSNGVSGDFASIIKEGFETNNSIIEKGAKEVGELWADSMTDAMGSQLEKKTPEEIQGALNSSVDSMLSGIKSIGNKVGSFFTEGMSEGMSTPEGGEAVTMPSVVPSAETMTEEQERFLEHLEFMKNAMKEFDESINELIGTSISGTFGMLGDAIGNALATGGNVLQAAGNAILAGLGAFLSDMGGMLIKYGTLAVLKGKLDLAILAGGPVAISAGIAAIGVGIALKAAGSALGSFANQGSGGYSGNTGSSGNIGPNSSTGSSTSFSGAESNSLQDVVFVLKGTDLVGSVNNTLTRNKSLSGNITLR